MRTGDNGSLNLTLSGSMGVGKSSLLFELDKLIQHATIYYEHREPVARDFFLAPDKHAFPLQLAYSLQYLQRAIEISRTTGCVLQERSILEAHGVFTELMRRQGTITATEFDLLKRISDITTQFLKPNVTILLEVPVEVSAERIRQRAHCEEKAISETFLFLLKAQYEVWFSDLPGPKLRLAADKLSIAEMAEAIIRTLDSSHS